MPEKQAPDEVDDKTGQKVALYFASEFDFSVSSAHEAVETARRLAESLEAVSSNQYFSQSSVKKWFLLKTQVDILVMRAEAAGTRLVILQGKAENSLLRKEKPSLSKARVGELAKEFSKLTGLELGCFEKAIGLLEEIRSDSEIR